MYSLKKSTYIFPIDAIRVVAILGVILIHSTTKTLQVGNHAIYELPISLLLNQLFRFAVPIFFLISGFVLELNARDKINFIIYFKKRLSRVLIPYLFWSVFYVLVSYGINVGNIFSTEFISKLIRGTASYHLYFIPTLLIFYLLFPFLHNFIKILKKTYVLAILLFIQLSISFIDYYLFKLQLNEIVRIIILTFNFFVLGMILSLYKDKLYIIISKHFKKILSTLILISLLNYIMVFVLTLSQHTNSYIYNQYGPLNFAYSILTFFVLFYLFEKLSKFRNIIKTLSKLSFFIFFIHVFIQTTLWNNFIPILINLLGRNIIKNIFFDPIVFLFIASISFTIAFIVCKIPNIYKLTG